MWKDLAINSYILQIYFEDKQKNEESEREFNLLSASHEEGCEYLNLHDVSLLSMSK